MSTFVPSSYSNPSASRGVSNLTVVAPIIRTASNALKSKDKKYADAIFKAEKFKDKYDACCKRRGKKKGCYPDKKGKGIIKTDCRGVYKDWKSWEKKAAKRAEKLGDELEDEGKLDNQTRSFLATSIVRPVTIAQAEAKNVNKKRRDRGERPISEEAFIRDAYTPEAIDVGISPVMVGVGAIGVVGVAAGLWYAFGR